MGAVTMVLAAAAIVVSTTTSADAWKWRKWNLFGDGDGDGVVTVAADGRAVYPYPVYRTYSGYRTVLLRLPALPDFDPPVPVVTRVRHVFGVPPPALPPPPPTTRYGPPAPSTRYGAPAPAPSNAATTAAAVAAAVARTILEAHGFSRDVDQSGHRDLLPPTESRAVWSDQRAAGPPFAGEDPGLYWQHRGLQRVQQGRGASWRR